MKKRFFALMLVFAMLFTFLISLSSCGEKYKPVKSTKEEKETVIEISYEKEKYEVPYELYRAFFLQYKSVVDGGNEEVWTGAEKEKYIKAADELVYKSLAEIFSVFHLCKKADINVYSKSFDKLIKENIEVAIDGGTLGGESYVGYGGDYEKYLASLKEMNLNYSAAEFMMRYQLARQSLVEYYVSTLVGDDEEDTPAYSKEDVLAFYLSEEESRRIIVAEFPSHLKLEEAEKKREELLKIATNPEKTLNDIIIYVANNTLSNPKSEVIGKYTNDSFYYSELTESAFSLKIGGVSEIITLKTAEFDGYAVIYRLPADTDFFEENYDDIAASYVLNEFGKAVAETAAEIEKAITPTDELNNLDRSKVSMN